MREFRAFTQEEHYENYQYFSEAINHQLSDSTKALLMEIAEYCTMPEVDPVDIKFLFNEYCKNEYRIYTEQAPFLSFLKKTQGNKGCLCVFSSNPTVRINEQLDNTNALIKPYFSQDDLLVFGEAYYGLGVKKPSFDELYIVCI